ncbi:DUF1353 domain-containing protein [Pseudomonas atacamensis]|uniref:DUF1353 domain-containing protein n=1 Tax=Pseudomonas atacamensis TaxID=2565368 RepID=UPI00300EF1D7
MREITRRSLLEGFGGGLIYSMIHRPIFATENSDPGSSQQWMDDLFARKSVSSPFKLQKFLDPIYIVDQPLDWEPDAGQEKLKSVIVPRGFVTDLASIPRVFWSELNPADEYAYAAVVHDYLYWTQELSKEDSDLILKYAMENLEVSKTKIFIIYQAVKNLGTSAWNNNKRLKDNGEKRILVKFPSDPKTRWSDWKLRSDVF